MKRGEVYRFNYLWSQDADRRREGGLKVRRVCLMMRIDDWLYLFPLTSLAPEDRDGGGPRIFEIVPDIERRRIGLGADGERVTYLILDDYNKVRIDELYDFQDLTPVGAFSSAFLVKMARRFLDARTGSRSISGRSRR